MVRPMPVLPAVPSTMVPPGLQQPAPLGVADDEERRAVLDRLAGIEELRLAPDFAAGHVRDAVEADQRGVADRGDNIGTGIEHVWLLGADCGAVARDDAVGNDRQGRFSANYHRSGLQQGQTAWA